LLGSVQPFTPVEIKVKFEASPKGRFCKSSEDSGLKDGEFQTIFKGFLFTPAQTKAGPGGSVSLTFNALGYPAALGGSTKVTTGLISTKLASMDDHIAVRIGDASGRYSLHTVGAMLLTQKDMRVVDDFILNVLFKDILAMLSSYASTERNNSAQLELARMTSYPLGTKKMSLNYGSTPADLWKKALGRTYTDSLNVIWKGQRTDLWSLLVEFANLFLFKFVPAINHDALVPVTYGLDGNPWRKYEPSDYWKMTITPEAFSQEFYSYVGKVGLVGPNTNYNMYQEKMPLGVAMGYAELKPGGSLKQEIKAKMITERAPLFMMCPGPACRTSGIGTPSPDARNPNTGIPDVHHGADMTVFYGGDLGNGYAKTILHDKVFEHRQCTVQGRFRLDITPGSLIQVTTIGDRFVQKSEKLFGHALRVTLFVDPEGAGAGTAVTLGSLRTENEHKQYTVPLHPLYNVEWRGAMLTD